MGKRRRSIIILSIITLAIIGGLIFKFATPKQEYKTRPVSVRDITQVVEASGTINPVNTVSVGSTVSGLISGLYADYNSVVKKGQLLAEIDPRTFQATVDQNKAALYNAKSTMKECEATLELNKKMYDRYKKLYEKQYVPLSEVDKAESDYKASLAKYEAAKFQIKKAEATYNSSLVNLGYTKIIAPVDGIIISRDIDLGQPVAATLNAPELFTIAQDIEKMQIEVAVSEADIGKVKDGQKAKYVLDGYPNEEFFGEVTQVRIDSTTT
ncbi:MAG: efflux RND transporter periplasmic adaptor subunit, partial [Opitutales bacterium]|nr:efflux RND transporter periplasmic adaptor subunit [Opitutales bacterium]